MEWFKFFGGEFLSDPKMLALTSDERSCWLTLLCYSSVNDNGMIKNLSEQQLMMQSGMDFMQEDWGRTVGVIEKLKNLEMIHIDNGKITIINWQKRQETNLTSYERVKKYRKKKHNDNTMITLEENRREENRRDKEEDVAVATFDQFWEEYPKKELKKKSLEIWKRKKFDVKLKVILDFIIKAKETDRWQKGYVKQPPAFLNGECWNDDLNSYNDKKPAQLQGLDLRKK